MGNYFSYDDYSSYSPSSTYCYSHSDCDSSAPFCYSYSGSSGYCTDCSYCAYCSDGIDGTCGSGCAQTTYYGTTCSPASPAPAPAPQSLNLSHVPCNWTMSNSNTNGESWIGSDYTNQTCIAAAYTLGCDIAQLGGSSCYCQFGTNQTSDSNGYWYACFLNGYCQTNNCTELEGINTDLSSSSSYDSNYYYNNWNSYCYDHSDCSGSTPFCYSYGSYGTCSSCDSCYYCSSGIDGTCGSACGQTTYFGTDCSNNNQPTSSPTPYYAPSTSCHSHSDCTADDSFCYLYSSWYTDGYCTDCHYCSYCSYGIDGSCGDGCDQTTYYGAACEVFAISSSPTPAPTLEPTSSPLFDVDYPRASECHWVETNANTNGQFEAFGGPYSVDECIEFTWNHGCDIVNYHAESTTCTCQFGEDRKPQYGSKYQACFLNDFRDLHPTNAPTASPDFQLASIAPGTKLFLFAVMVIGIDIIIFVLCVAYLLCFSDLLKKTQMPGTATVCQTLKSLGATHVCGLLLEIFDIVTDYVYAVNLITIGNELGWISILSAILGLLLFGMKLALTKKLIGFQEYNLERKLERNSSYCETMKIIQIIRDGRMELDVLSLLIACIEDVPQALIVCLLAAGSMEWDTFGLVNLSFAVISFGTKLLQIISSKFGCKDTSSIKRMSRLSRVSKIEIQSPSSSQNINEMDTNSKFDEGAKQMEMMQILSSPIRLSTTN